MKKNTVSQGTIYLAASAAFFVICSYAMHSVLGRLLHPDLYGIFGLVFSILVWLEILFGGIAGATVKTVAKRLTPLKRVERDSVFLLLGTAAVILAVTLAAAPLLARLFKEPSISFYLMIAVIDVPFMAMYRAYLAMINGMQQYGRQSIATMSYIFFKALFVIGFVILGLSVTGALVGNVIASVAGLVLTYSLFKGCSRKAADWGREGRNAPSVSTLARTAIPFTAFSLLYNLLMNMDLWMVQGQLSDSTRTGYYVAAVNLSRAPYYILSALTLALFPAIAGSISRGDHARTSDYIRRAYRTLIVLLMPVAVFMAVSSTRLVTLIYSASYVPAAGPLVILSFSYGAFALIIASLNMLMADDDFREVLVIEASLLALDIVLCLVLIPRHGLNGAAASTLITCLLGSLACFIVVKRNLTISPDATCFLRATASSILASVLLLIPGSSLLLLILYPAAGLVYLLLLWFLGELGPEDLVAFKGLLGMGG